MQRDYRRDWANYSVDAIPSKSKLPDFLWGLLAREQARTVLDFGCGIGKHSIELAQQGYRVVGTDINAKAIEKARADALATVSSQDLHRLNFYLDKPGSFPLRETTFDAAILQLVISVIGGSDERRLLLAKAKKFLKQDGLLYLSASGVSDDINQKYAETYARDFPETGEMYTYLSRDSAGNVLYVTHHFTQGELEKLLTPNFKDITIRKEKEASSRRPDEAAWFFYVTAKAK